MYDIVVPYIPLYGFQDSYHRLKSLIITSDLQSAGEISLANAAAYRILSDFKYTPSVSTMTHSASKKKYMNTDNNYISENMPGNVDYFCANGTHGRLIAMRGHHPLYSCVVSVVTNCIEQNQYDIMTQGYYRTTPNRAPATEYKPLRVAPGAHFDCKLVFLSKHTEEHVSPNYGRD